ARRRRQKRRIASCLCATLPRPASGFAIRTACRIVSAGSDLPLCSRCLVLGSVVPGRAYPRSISLAPEGGSLWEFLDCRACTLRRGPHGISQNHPDGECQSEPSGMRNSQGNLPAFRRRGHWPSRNVGPPTRLFVVLAPRVVVPHAEADKGGTVLVHGR